MVVYIKANSKNAYSEEFTNKTLKIEYKNALNFQFLMFFFKQKTAYEISLGLVGSEMCIRDSSKYSRLR